MSNIEHAIRDKEKTKQWQPHSGSDGIDTNMCIQIVQWNENDRNETKTETKSFSLRFKKKNEKQISLKGLSHTCISIYYGPAYRLYLSVQLGAHDMTLVFFLLRSFISFILRFSRTLLHICVSCHHRRWLCPKKSVYYRVCACTHMLYLYLHICVWCSASG